MAESIQIETRVPNSFRRQLFMYLIQCILGSAHEKFGVWNGPNRNVTVTGSSLKRTSVFVGDYFARDWHKKVYQ